jgi:hypothetical protein
MVSFAPEVEDVLLDGLRDALATGLSNERVHQRLLEVSTLAHCGWDAPPLDPTLAPDVVARASELGAVVIRLASPVELKHHGQVVRQPTLGHILRAGRYRAQTLGYELPWVPSVDDPAAEGALVSIEGPMSWYRHERESTGQGKRYPLEGVTGSIAARLAPDEALRLAIAETLGVGSSTSQGMGVLRVEPL